MRIFKYVLELEPEQTVDMHNINDGILSIQVQDDKVVMWASVDPTSETAPQKFIMVGTGHEIPVYNLMRYVDTVQLNGLVWHIFNVG